MFAVIIGLVVGVAILLALEYRHKQGKVSTEASRKTIHVVTGIILVTWSFFVPWSTILFVEILYLMVAALVRHYMPLDSQHGVNRRSWGEFFFSFGVIASILLGAPRWVFILAILHLALGDAIAALIGLRYGKGNQYMVFGHQKSIAGTAAFVLTSFALVAITVAIAPEHVEQVGLWRLLILPIVTTLSENAGIYGTDNLLIPLGVILVLTA